MNKNYKKKSNIKEEKTQKDKEEHIERIRKRKVKINNKTGIKGVRLRKDGKYEVQITDQSKQYYLGRYDTLEEAIQARIDGEKDIGVEFIVSDVFRLDFLVFFFLQNNQKNFSTFIDNGYKPVISRVARTDKYVMYLTPYGVNDIIINSKRDKK